MDLIKCDSCNKEIVELYGLQKLTSSYYHLHVEGGFSDTKYDFCNLVCLLNWIDDTYTKDESNKQEKEEIK